MKLKRILATVLCVAMVLSTMSFSVFAENANVASVGGTGYETLDEALAAATAGDTITLLADMTFSGQNAADKLSGYVIDLNEKTITLSGNTYLTGETTIKNGNILVSGYVSDSYLCLYTADTKLTLDDVSLTGTMDCYAVLNAAAGSTLIIKDSTIDVVGNVTNPDEMGNIIYGGNVTVDNSTIKGVDTVRGIGFSNITITNSSVVEITGTDGDSKLETGLNCATVTVDGSVVTIENATKRAVRLNNNALTLQNAATLTATDCAADIIGIGTTDTVSVSSDSTLDAVDNVTPSVTYVAKVGNEEFTDIQEAIKAAAPSGTIELLADVTVDEWKMFAETLNASGRINTLNINGLTINGNNKTLTIKSIESAGNGDRLFYDAQNLNINNLTIECIDDAANLGGIGLKSGTLNGVNFVGGGYGILPGEGNITITDCEFATNNTAIYYEGARDNLVVDSCEFNQPDSVNVILLRGKTTFTNNIVNSGRTVNVASGSPVVTGNDFNNVRLKVYNEATATIKENKINVLVFNDENTVKSTFGENTYSADAEQALKDVGVIEEPALSGEGTEANPYIIATLDDLKLFNEMGKSDSGAGNLSGKFFSLTADIDFAWGEWHPFNFYGTFIGNGKTIKNLTYIPNADGRMGFFQSFAGTVEGGLTLDGIKGTVPASGQFGGFTRYLNANVTNVHVKNIALDVDKNADWLIGGFSGYVNSGYATDCSVENFVVNAPESASGPCIGGFIGSFRTNTTFTNCDVKGFKATVSSTGDLGLAGFVPHTQTGWNNVKFIDCDVTGIDFTVTGRADVAGFITWPGSHTAATNCHTAGKIDVTGVTTGNYVGGFYGNLGWNADLGQMGHFLKDCSADVDILTNVSDAGGFIGSATVHNNGSKYLECTNCSASGDVTVVEGGTADAGAFAGSADRGVYNDSTASGTVTNNGTGKAGQFIGNLLDVTPTYDYRYPAGTREYAPDVTAVLASTYTGASTGLAFIGTADANATYCDTEEEFEAAKLAYAIANGRVAKVGNNCYKTLAAAIAAANTGDTVTLLTDITLTETVKISAGKKVTLDLSGHTIDIDAAVWVYGANNSGTAPITVCYGGDLTIDDSSENKTGLINGNYGSGLSEYDTYAAVMMTAKGDDAANGTAKLTVNNGTLKGFFAAVAGNKDRDNTEIVINGGKLTADVSDKYSSAGIEHPMNGKLTINGGIIEGMDGISFRSGQLSITGGTIIGNAPTGTFDDDGYWDNDFAACTGHALQIVSRASSNPANETPSVVITGGTFKAENTTAIGSYAAAGDTQIVGFISGGTFNSDVSAYLANGFELIDNGDGTYGVIDPAYGKTIKVTYADGTVEYFNDMRLAVPHTTNYPKLEGATITLLDDVAGLGMRFMENGMVFDLNGHTYTLTGGTGSQGTETSAFQIRPEVTDTATIKNGTIKIADDVAICWIFNNYATNFIVEDVVVDCGNLDYSYGESCYIHVSRSGDNTNLTGTTKFINFDSAVAGSAINVGGTMTIADTVDIGTLVVELDESATLTAKEGLNVVAAEGLVLSINNGTYTAVAPVAQVGEGDAAVYYTSLQKAIDAAQPGNTITLLSDVTEDVTINKNIILDGAYKKYTGKMTANVGITATVQNVNFVNGGIDKSTKSTTGNYTIKNCTFDGQGTFAYPLRFKGANTVTVEDCTVKDYLYSFLYISHGTNTVSVKNVTVEDCPNYAVYFASGVNNATIENLTVKNSTSGLVINNTANRALTIKDCKMENVGTAISHSNGTNTITCTVLGANDFGTSASSEYAKYVLGENATLKAPEGYTVTASDDAYFVKYVDGTYKAVKAIAQIGDVKYASLAEAIAEGGDVILLADVENVGKIVVNKGVSLDLNGKTISGVCDEGQKYVFMVNNGVTMTIKDSSDAETGKITYAGNNSTGWIVDVEGELVLESGTLELTGTWGIGYAIDVRPNAWGTAYTEETSFVMNGGKIISSDGAVRVASSSADSYKDVSASFTMNGGEIEAAWDGVFVQQSNAVWDVLNVTINNGTIKSDLNPIRFYGPAATSYVNGEDCVDIALNGGTLTYTGTETYEWLVDEILRIGGGVTADDFMKDCAVTASTTFAATAKASEGYQWKMIDGETMGLVPVVNYAFALEADKDKLYKKGEEVAITLSVNSEDTDSFYSITGTLTFDATKLAYTSGASDNGSIAIMKMYEGTGAGFATGEYKTFTFQVLEDIQANETLTFTMNGDVVPSREDAFSQYNALAEATETVDLVAPYTVTLPEGLTGATTVIHGTEYVVSVEVPEELHKNNKYTITYTCGTNSDSKVVTATDSTFTVPADHIVGDLVFTFESEAKFEVEVYNGFITGGTMILVKGDAVGYLFNDNGTDYAMYQVGNYKYGDNDEKEARAWVVLGDMTKEQAFDRITIDETKASVRIKEGHDVNSYAVMDGKITFRDATAAHASYQVGYELPKWVRAYLASDVNGDKQVHTSDMNEILNHSDYVEY